MKKTLVLMLVLSIVLSFSACRKPNDHPTTLTTPATLSSTVAPTTQKPTTEPPFTTVLFTTQAPTTELPVTTVPPTTQAPTTESPVTTVPPTTQPTTTEPPVTTVPPTMQAPTTEPTVATIPPTTESLANYCEKIVSNSSGRWYLSGYSDVCIDISKYSYPNTSVMNIKAYNFSFPMDGESDFPIIEAYTVYPGKYVDSEKGAVWSASIEIPFNTWYESLANNRINIENTYISIGDNKFIRTPGNLDRYSGTCYREAVGTWYLENHPDSSIEIFIYEDQQGDFENSAYFGINSTWFDFSNFETNTTYYVGGGYADRPSDWEKYGISVEDEILTITNENGSRYFYKERTYPNNTEPPQTEPIETEPTVTVPPATEPPQTEPATTPPSTTVPPADVLIISDTQTLSNQTIDTDVYITSTGVATFDNVTVNGNVYCYGQLTVNGGSANNLYAYYWDMGFMTSSCDAWDGAHGLVKGAFSSCGEVVLKDHALDQAFSNWGKQ